MVADEKQMLEKLFGLSWFQRYVQGAIEQYGPEAASRLICEKAEMLLSLHRAANSQ